MKIIEAMKKIKLLLNKITDEQKLIAEHHADLDIENPTYGTVAEQTEIISKKLQGIRDMVHEISSLRFSIQKSNVTIPVTIEIGGNRLTKTIAEWIHRRKDLCTIECNSWACMNDKGMRSTGVVKQTNGQERQVQIRRYYDPKKKDAEISVLKSEPLLIDSALEIVNATTELV